MADIPPQYTCSDCGRGVAAPGPLPVNGDPGPFDLIKGVFDIVSDLVDFSD